MLNIAILALENCMKSSVTGPFDILSVASMEWKQNFSEKGEELFRLSIITKDGSPATSFNGMKIESHGGISGCPALDIIIIPVVYGEFHDLLADRKLINWLKDLNQQGTTICAVCAGVFLAAETGLLHGRKATTHWHLADEFETRYPSVTLKREKMIVDEGDFITAGGVTAYMDLSIYLTGRFGSAKLASTVSKILLIDPRRRSQIPYSSFNYNKAHGDVTVLGAQEFMEKRMDEQITVPAIAEQAGLGIRTFARRFKKATGDTPLEYIQHLRIDKARSMLETTGKSVEEITYSAGYEDVSSFRKLFKKATGLSPGAYRKRFSLY